MVIELSTNATIANMKQVTGYGYNAKSLRDGSVTPKTVHEDRNGNQSVEAAQKLSGRNGPFKASKKSFGSFIA